MLTHGVATMLQREPRSFVIAHVVQQTDQMTVRALVSRALMHPLLGVFERPIMLTRPGQPADQPFPALGDLELDARLPIATPRSEGCTVGCGHVLEQTAAIRS